jgi:hypothetical protein
LLIPTAHTAGDGFHLPSPGNQFLAELTEVPGADDIVRVKIVIKSS